LQKSVFLRGTLYFLFNNKHIYVQQARSQISTFGGAQYIFEGASFLVFLYV